MLNNVEGLREAYWKWRNLTPVFLRFDKSWIRVWRLFRVFGGMKPTTLDPWFVDT